MSSAQERAVEVLYQRVMGDPHSGVLPFEVWRGACDWYAEALADANLLVDDDTARLVALGRAVEAMERLDESVSVIGNGMWNACLDAIYREAGVRAVAGEDEQ